MMTHDEWQWVTMSGDDDDHDDDDDDDDESMTTSLTAMIFNTDW